jgi:hypothetical protein
MEKEKKPRWAVTTCKSGPVPPLTLQKITGFWSTRDTSFGYCFKITSPSGSVHQCLEIGCAYINMEKWFLFKTKKEGEAWLKQMQG